MDDDAAAGASAEASPGGVSALRPEVAGDWVTIDAVAAGDPSDLEAELIALGATNTAIAGRVVSARLPIAVIPQLEGVMPLQFARQALAATNAGLVTSQGDHAMRADIARDLFGLDGSGVMVGVLSESFNCLGGFASDIASGDLPANVMVMDELPDCSTAIDEGRAMLQIVHDVAPSATLTFATAFTGQANFADNIRDLRDAGAKVIVDDVYYPLEPMFQDGVIAQAVDEVTASGVTYFSSAGNHARLGYDHAFVPGPFIPDLGGIAHNFGGTTMQRMTMPFGTYRIVLQWDSPFFSVSGPPGTPTDLDIFVLQSNGAGGFVLVTWAVTDNILSGDSVEVVGFQCPFSQCVAFIVITHYAGPIPGRMKYIILPRAAGKPTLSPAINSGTIFGHANANGAIAVGAANYKTPTTLESFSSGGTTPVLFNTAGNLLSQPDMRQFKPDVVAPDGADTTFSEPMTAMRAASRTSSGPRPPRLTRQASGPDATSTAINDAD